MTTVRTTAAERDGSVTGTQLAAGFHAGRVAKRVR